MCMYICIRTFTIAHFKVYHCNCNLLKHLPFATSTPFHAFAVSHLNYCSAIFEGLPTCPLKCLDRVLRTASRLVGRIPKFGRFSGYMWNVIQWLPCIDYRISALVRCCIECLAPSYLRELCCYSASYLIALFCIRHTRTVIRQRRTFSVAGPTAWNGLPLALHLTPVGHSALFLSGLNTTLFDRGWAGNAPE